MTDLIICQGEHILFKRNIIQSILHFFVQFRCDSGQCINGYYQCDGDRDCSDGSDELGCNQNVLRRMTAFVDRDRGVDFLRVWRGVDNRTKNEFSDSLRNASQGCNSIEKSGDFI